jgi:hypothetical protein
MADFGRGIKAGAAVAAIYLIASIILEVTGFSDQFSGITMAAGLRIHLELLNPSFVITLILTYIAPYVVRGIVFGAVFAALYDYLPGVTSVVKGVVLSLFLWILAVVQIIYTTPGWAWHADGFSCSWAYYSGMISLSSVGPALAGIISSLVFGVLTGFLWDRFRGKGLIEEREGRPVLLISLIVGGVLWALGAVPFVMGVVIFGGPTIAPDFWWRSVLCVLVAFLGFPGWILALVAWRKTERGETGFKLGVAGGVIMALTGIMLLPGILAIIGGVLSRRRVASEPTATEIAK